MIEGFSEPEYPDWRSLLRALARQATRTGWRGPLVIDELPYLVAASPELPSLLQAFMDHDARQAGLCIVLAGSSQRMMQGLQLDRSSPLFGRAAEAIELQPLPAGYIGEAIGSTDAVASVRAWSAWGGIPRYWELAASYGTDIKAAVDSLVLDPMDGPFQERDWKYLSSVKSEMLNELCCRILKKAAEITSGGSEPAYQRYQLLYRHIVESDDMVADCFDDWRRSAIRNMVLILRHHRLLTEEHVKHLSENAQSWLRTVEKELE